MLWRPAEPAACSRFGPQAQCSQLDGARAFVEQLLSSTFSGMVNGDDREHGLEVGPALAALSGVACTAPHLRGAPALTRLPSRPRGAQMQVNSLGPKLSEARR
jgi:hypothetical protein